MPNTTTRSIRDITAEESAKFPYDDYEATREIGQSSGVAKLLRGLLTRSTGKVRIAKSLDMLRGQINALVPKPQNWFRRMDRRCITPISQLRSQSVGARWKCGCRHGPRYYA